MSEDHPVRVVDAFIDELDLAALGFAGVVPEATGRPSDRRNARMKREQPSQPLRSRRLPTPGTRSHTASTQLSLSWVRSGVEAVWCSANGEMAAAGLYPVVRLGLTR